MTRSSCQSTTIILLLVILLATNVRAHPTGSEGFDPSDFDWAFAGEQVSSMLAHSQFAHLTASPMGGDYHRAASAEPLYHPTPRSQPIPIPNAAAGCFAPFDFETMSFAGEQNRLAQMQVHNDYVVAPRTPIIMQDRCATPNSVHGLSNGQAHLPWNRVSHGNAPFVSQMDDLQCGPPAHTQLSFAEPQYGDMAGYAHSAPTRFESRCYLQQQNVDLRQLFPELDQHMPDSCEQGQRSQAESMNKPATSSPQVLSNENLGHHNLNMRPHASGHMKGWLGRASAAGEGNMLRLDTGRLAPPAMSDAHLSPSSASSAGSSSGRSIRRSKDEMLLGEINCAQCDAAFNTQGDLTHHLRSHAPYQSRSHVCPHCDKRFQYRKDLSRHVPRHDPNRQRFYCRYPGCKFHTKGFGRQDHLDRHLASQHRIDSPMQISRTPSNRTSS